MFPERRECSFNVTKDGILPDLFGVKAFGEGADHTLIMTNSISSTSINHADQLSQQAIRQPQPKAEAPKNSSTPQDTVTLKSTGDVDHDGDSH